MAWWAASNSPQIMSRMPAATDAPPNIQVASFSALAVVFASIVISFLSRRRTFEYHVRYLLVLPIEPLITISLDQFVVYGQGIRAERAPAPAEANDLVVWGSAAS